MTIIMDMHEVSTIRDLYYLCELHEIAADARFLETDNLRDDFQITNLEGFVDTLEDMENYINRNLYLDRNPRSKVTILFNTNKQQVEVWIYDQVAHRNYMVEFRGKNTIVR